MGWGEAPLVSDSHCIGVRPPRGHGPEPAPRTAETATPQPIATLWVPKSAVTSCTVRKPCHRSRRAGLCGPGRLSWDADGHDRLISLMGRCRLGLDGRGERVPVLVCCAGGDGWIAPRRGRSVPRRAASRSLLAFVADGEQEDVAVEWSAVMLPVTGGVCAAGGRYQGRGGGAGRNAGWPCRTAVGDCSLNWRSNGTPGWVPATGVNGVQSTSTVLNGTGPDLQK
jgi:hypothetical protein